MRLPSLVLSLLVVSACGGGGGGGDCDHPPSQGPTEPCCTSYGADACGAGFFCAAFDGRTIATCYANGSRLDGEDCTANEQCASMECNTIAGACRAFASVCDPAIGCAAIMGARRACTTTAAGTLGCLPVGDGSGGALCADSTDCDAPLACDASTSTCSNPGANLGASCSTSLSTMRMPDSECQAPSTTEAACRGISCESEDSCTGFCVPFCRPGARDDCPEGWACFDDAMTGTGTCLPSCTTAEDCPLPELGCVVGHCRGCQTDTDCRAGRTCTSAAFGRACL